MGADRLLSTVRQTAPDSACSAAALACRPPATPRRRGPPPRCPPGAGSQRRSARRTGRPGRRRPGPAAWRRASGTRDADLVQPVAVDPLVLGVEVDEALAELPDAAHV